MSLFGGNFNQNTLPGQRQLPGDQPNAIWWGNAPDYTKHLVRGQDRVDSTADDAGNVDGSNDYSHILRTGLILGQVTATRRWKEWNPTATDGSNVVRGVLNKGIDMHNQNGVREEKVAQQILSSGYVIPERLIVPGAQDRGLDQTVSGISYEILLATQLEAAGFVLGPQTDYTFGPFVRTNTANRTLSINEHDNIQVNNGAGGSIALTLPAPTLGCRFPFLATESNDMVITAGTSGDIQVAGSTYATATIDTIGEKAILEGHLIGSSVKWLLVASEGSVALA